MAGRRGQASGISGHASPLPAPPKGHKETQQGASLGLNPRVSFQVNFYVTKCSFRPHYAVSRIQMDRTEQVGVTTSVASSQGGRMCGRPATRVCSVDSLAGPAAGSWSCARSQERATNVAAPPSTPDSSYVTTSTSLDGAHFGSHAFFYMFSIIEQLALSGLMGSLSSQGRTETLWSAMVAHSSLISREGLHTGKARWSVLSTILCLTLLPFSIIILYLAFSLFETAHF